MSNIGMPPLPQQAGNGQYNGMGQHYLSVSEIERLAKAGVAISLERVVPARRSHLPRRATRAF